MHIYLNWFVNLCSIQLKFSEAPCHTKTKKQDWKLYDTVGIGNYVPLLHEKIPNFGEL